jgi:hypothetical protein
MQACTSFNPLPSAPLKGEGAGGFQIRYATLGFTALRACLSLREGNLLAEREDYTWPSVRRID